MVTTKKAAVESEKKKGELMENDQDAMEVTGKRLVSPGKRGICLRKRSPSILGMWIVLLTWLDCSKLGRMYLTMYNIRQCCSLK